MDGLTKAFTYISLIYDPRAPKDIPKEVIKALPPNPVIIKLKKYRWELFKVI
jgi:hypothetical protein